MIAVSAVVLAALATQYTPPPLSASVANVTVIGLEEEQVSEVKGRLDAELADLGATVFPGPVVEADCVPDPECLRNAMKDSGAAVWLYFEAIRVGPVVQIAATLYDDQANELASGQSQADDPDNYPGDGPLLPPEVRGKIEEMLAARGDAAPAVQEIAPVEPQQPPSVGGDGMSTMQTAGLFVGGVGAVATVVSGILATHEILVLEDAGSAGDDKARAQWLAWVGLGGTLLGVAAAGSGAGMYFVSE